MHGPCVHESPFLIASWRDMLLFSVNCSLSAMKEPECSERTSLSLSLHTLDVYCTSNYTQVFLHIFIIQHSREREREDIFIHFPHHHLQV